MARRAGPKTRRMSPGRRAVSRLERLKELNARVSTERVGDVNFPSVDPGTPQLGQPMPDSTSSRRDASGPPAQPSLTPVYLPARMINEFVYCPRLFYYEQVERRIP
jgi:hypothetical protein